ncbi:MAG: PAS domain S-box protein [Candidatus Desulfofervidaceae bacterium]|nr:PAS domain S-box protein [Candidatus Desulfofervidaceae bacterium]
MIFKVRHFPKYIYTAVLLALVFFAVMQFYQYQKSLKEVRQRYDLALTYKLEKVKKGIQKDIINVVTAFHLALEHIYAENPSPRILSFILYGSKIHLPAKSVFFVDPNGHLFFPLSQEDKEFPASLSLSEFSQTEEFSIQLKRARITKKTTFFIMDLLHFFKPTENRIKKPFLAVITPIYTPSTQKYIGAAVAILDLNALLEDKLSAISTFYPNVKPIVIDEKGRIVFHPQKGMLYQTVWSVIKDLPPFYQKRARITAQKMLAGQQGADDWFCPELFKDSRVVYTPFIFPDNTRWVFACCYPKNIVQKKFYLFLKSNIVFSLLVLLSLSVVLWFTNYFYTRTFNTISHYQQAIESLIDPFVITDLQGRCVHYNVAFKKITGKKIKLGERLCLIEPEFGKGRMPPWHQEMFKAVRNGKNYELHRYKFQTAEGEPFYARVTFSVIKDLKGKPSYVAIDFNNITHQVDLEEQLEEYTEHLERLVIKRTQALAERTQQYREIFENQMVGIFIIRPSGEFLMYNQTFKELTGYSDEELSRLNFKEICSPSEHAALLQLFQKCLEQKNVFYKEVKIFPKTQNTIFVDLFFQVTKFKNETAILGFIYDVTQRKALEEKLREQDRIAILGEMAAGVAHDINNLLMMVLGNLELASLSLEKETPQAKSYLQKAMKVLEEGEAIVRRLYAYAHKRLQTAEIIPDLNQLIKDTVILTKPFWRTRAQQEGKTVQIKEDYSKVGPVAGNPAELKELFINLIKNAVEAMPKGGEITIKTWQEKGKNWVMIKDTGQGIPDILKAKIFEPFFSTKGEKGSGLGLAISLGIIRAHGGDIKVESEVEKGTAFYISLPIVQPELIPMEAKEEKEKQVVFSKLSEGKFKILVVDDEPEILNIISEILTNLGLDTLKAETPEKAMELFNQHLEEIGLVITDLGMPEISGFELADKIKAIKPDIPVVLLTGWGAAVMPEELKKHKIDHVLSKPLVLDKLKQVLTKYGFKT